MATRKRPATPAEAPPQNETEGNQEENETVATNGNKGKVKEPALYHVYESRENGNKLSFLVDVTAKTAEAAVSEAVSNDETLVGKTLVAIPDRNFKTFSTEVKTTTRVKVSAAG